MKNLSALHQGFNLAECNITIVENDTITPLLVFMHFSTCYLTFHLMSSSLLSLAGCHWLFNLLLHFKIDDKADCCNHVSLSTAEGHISHTFLLRSGLSLADFLP